MEDSKALLSILKDTYNDLQLNEDGRVNFYSSVEDEYEILLHGVGVRDISFYQKLFIHGKNSLDLLDRLATNSLGELNELEWERTLFTNTEGRIIDRTLLLKFEDYFLLIGGCTDSTKLLKWIKRFVQKDDITLSDASTEYSMFEIIGPESDSYMALIAGEKLDELQNHNIIRVQIENYFIHSIKYVDVGDVSKHIIVVDSKYANYFCNYLLKNKSVFNLNFIGESAYNVFRIERGIPIAPNELNDQFTPREANLKEEIDLDKRGYIGCDQIKNVIYDNSAVGRLCGLVFNEKLSENHADITLHSSDGVQIGIVTSLASPNMIENTIAVGYIDSDYNGNELVASDGTSKFNVKLIDFPIKR